VESNWVKKRRPANNAVDFVGKGPHGPRHAFVGSGSQRGPSIGAQWAVAYPEPQFADVHAEVSRAATSFILFIILFFLLLC